MEPLNDKELSQILEQWKAPGAPPNLEMPEQRGPKAARSAYEGWWRVPLTRTTHSLCVPLRRTTHSLCAWFVTGSIRIPVPIGVAILIALLLWVYSREAARPVATPAAKPISLSDFQPVKQLQPRVIGRANEGN
jgi:hypothetical protein